MKKTSIITLALSPIILIGGSLVAEDDPKQAFDALFGQEAKKVSAARDTKESAAFAKKLLEAAMGSPKSRRLQALLCEKAYEFGLKDASGWDTAVDAMKLLAEAAPDEKPKAEDNLLKVLKMMVAGGTAEQKEKAADVLAQRSIALGDEAMRAGKFAEAAGAYREAAALAASMKLDCQDESAYKLRRAQEADNVDRQIAPLWKAVQSNPKNQVAARKLLMLHLVDRDDPAKALEVLTTALPEEPMRAGVELAGKPEGELNEEQCAALVEFYMPLAGKAGEFSKARVLARVSTYARRFLSLHEARDARRTAVAVRLAEAEKELARLGPPAPKPVLNLLSKWKIERGKWEQTDGRIVGSGDSRLKLIRDLPGDCTLTFKMDVISGMRPRVYFGDAIYVGNEGFQKELRIYGADAHGVKGDSVPYRNGETIVVQIVLDGAKVEFYANGKLACKCTRTASKRTPLTLSGGDDWSKGKTAFWDFRVEQKDEKPAGH